MHLALIIQSLEIITLSMRDQQLHYYLTAGFLNTLSIKLMSLMHEILYMSSTKLMSLNIEIH